MFLRVAPPLGRSVAVHDRKRSLMEYAQEENVQLSVSIRGSTGGEKTCGNHKYTSASVSALPLFKKAAGLK